MGVFPGCNQAEMCLSNQNAIQTTFYSAYYTTDKDSTLSDASVYGFGNEDSLIYNEEDITEMYLPLSFEEDETVYIITNKSLHDTIWIEHTKELNFISRDCGFSFNFEIDTIRYTKAFIDSVALIYPDVKYGESFENVKIYLY